MLDSFIHIFNVYAELIVITGLVLFILGVIVSWLFD